MCRNSWNFNFSKKDAIHGRMVHIYLYVYHINDWLDKMQILKIFSANKLMLPGTPGVCAEGVWSLRVDSLWFADRKDIRAVKSTWSNL